MRTLPFVILLSLAAPTAAAAQGVHLTYLGDAYAATYATDAVGAVRTQRVPLDAGTYEVDGRTFDVRMPPGPQETTRVVFVADMGIDRDASLVAQAIEEAEPDLVLFGGDLAYAHGDAEMWAEWFQIVEPFAARVPLMPAFGNHEGYCDDDDGYRACAQERAFYQERFPLPNGDALYYAFEWGPMRVTVLDTEAYLDDPEHPTQPEEQGAFLNDSLAAGDAAWDVVMYHRPLRTTNTHAGAAVGDQRAWLEEPLDGGADLVLQGHVHAYERSHATENGTLFVTSGGGGRALYDEWEAMEPWVAYRAAEHHFVLLDVSPTRIEGRAVRIDGSTLDSFTLERPAPATPSPPAPTSASPRFPSPPPPTQAVTPPDAGADNTSDPIDEANTPLPPVLVALALTLSARCWRRRARTASATA